MNESSQPLPSLHPETALPPGPFHFPGRALAGGGGRRHRAEPLRSAGDGSLGRLGHVAADRVDDLGAIEEACPLLG